jgi:hypothetical protein
MQKQVYSAKARETIGCGLKYTESRHLQNTSFKFKGEKRQSFKFKYKRSWGMSSSAWRFGSEYWGHHMLIWFIKG